MVTGIHHITAISGNAQRNLDFYTGFLGLRFVKKTVNFDDPFTYHLYFGDEIGSPGTIITFFPWGESVLKGRKGSGQVTTVSYSAPSAAQDFWLKRFKDEKVEYTGPFNRFGDKVILFEDPDGIENELCFSESENRAGYNIGIIPSEFSIRGFAGATLTVSSRGPSEQTLAEILGFSPTESTANRIRYKAADGMPGSCIDLLVYPDSLHGTSGTGSVHHIAFRASTDEIQNELRARLVKKGVSVTPVIDRNYFKSIYFREPGGVLFEVATDAPGFLIDEVPEELGTNLKLPAWYEKIRDDIQNKLPQLKIPVLNK